MFKSAGGALLILSLTSCMMPEQRSATESLNLTPAQASMAVLQAKSVAELLSKSFIVTSDQAFQSFEDSIPLRLEMKNPFGQDLKLIPSEKGFLFKFVTRKRRWRWDGEGEGVATVSQVYSAEGIHLAPSQTQGMDWVVELELGGEDTAIWELELGVQMHLSGVQFGERVLPLSKLQFQSTRVLAFPGGWRHISEDPFAFLEQVVEMPQVEADRQVLVAAALAAEIDRVACIKVLMAALDNVPNQERLRSIKAALEFLTGQRFPNRYAWRNWWKQQQESSSD